MVRGEPGRSMRARRSPDRAHELRGRGGRENTDLLALVLATYGTRCHLCGLEGANSKDHLVPWSHTRDNRLSNLRPAHVGCNSRRGNRVLPGYGADIVVVIGPPASGKTTWVRERAQPGDVVIDYDVIARALGADPSADEYAHPQHLAWVARGARRAAVERACRLAARCTVYIIHALPSARALDDYRFMRYRIQVVDPGYDVVRARCEASRPPSFMQAVSTWYGSYAGLKSTDVEAPVPALVSGPSDRTWW